MMLLKTHLLLLEYVEDRWGKNVANMVKGLTKVSDIREENFVTSKDSTDAKLFKQLLLLENVNSFC